MERLQSINLIILKIYSITINATNIVGSILVSLQIINNPYLLVSGFNFTYSEKDDFICKDNIPSTSTRIIKNINRSSQFSGYTSYKQLSDIIGLVEEEESHSAYTLSINFNTSFTKIGDYTFYLGVLDSGVLSIDNNVIIDLDKQCKSEIICNKSIVEIRQLRYYHINITTYSSNSTKIPYLSTYYNLPYSKVNNPFTVKTCIY